MSGPERRGEGIPVKISTLVAPSECAAFTDSIFGETSTPMGIPASPSVRMTGARSGRSLTFPLMYVPYRDGLLLVASQGGAPKHPSWYHNLVKHSDIVVNYRGRRMELRARLAEPDEKAELWPICDAHYAPYAQYRERTTRDIPIFVCEPTA